MVNSVLIQCHLLQLWVWLAAVNLIGSCEFHWQGGLQEVAEQLQLERIGPQHQAGSDSLLTGMAFFKMREVHSVNGLQSWLQLLVVISSIAFIPKNKQWGCVEQWFSNFLSRDPMKSICQVSQPPHILTGYYRSKFSFILNDETACWDNISFHYPPWCRKHHFWYSMSKPNMLMHRAARSFRDPQKTFGDPTWGPDP